MTKKGRRRGLREDYAYGIFLLAIDWGTHRLLTGELALDGAGPIEWRARPSERALLAPGP